MRRGSCTTDRPLARWDFHCHIRPGPGHILGGVSFIHPLAPSYAHRSAQQAGGAARSRNQEKLNEYLREHNCPGHTFRPISFDSLGRFIDGTMAVIPKVAHGACPGVQAPVHAGAVFPTFSVTWLWCGAATPLACSRRQLVSKPRISDLAGSRALIVSPRTCTANGEPWLGSTAWVSLHLAALLRQCRWESLVVVTF
jgi:hypothetical protein